MIPFYLCVILVAVQVLFDTQVNNSADNRCGCQCTDDTNGDGKCDETCGVEYSTPEQAFFCSIPSPPPWPPLLQIPIPQSRAVFSDQSCRRTGSCPVTILFTGNNQSLGTSMFFFPIFNFLAFFFGSHLYIFSSLETNLHVFYSLIWESAH